MLLLTWRVVAWSSQGKNSFTRFALATKFIPIY